MCQAGILKLRCQAGILKLRCQAGILKLQCQAGILTRKTPTFWCRQEDPTGGIGQEPLPTVPQRWKGLDFEEKSVTQQKSRLGGGIS